MTTATKHASRLAAWLLVFGVSVVSLLPGTASAQKGPYETIDCLQTSVTIRDVGFGNKVEQLHYANHCRIGITFAWSGRTRGAYKSGTFRTIPGEQGELLNGLDNGSTIEYLKACPTSARYCVQVLRKLIKPGGYLADYTGPPQQESPIYWTTAAQCGTMKGEFSQPPSNVGELKGEIEAKGAPMGECHIHKKKKFHVQQKGDVLGSRD